MIALSLSASLPDDARCAPCEKRFLPRSITFARSAAAGKKAGKVELPSAVGLATLIDWKKVEALAIA